MDDDMAVSMEKQFQEPGQFDAEQWSVEAAKAAMFEELLEELKAIVSGTEQWNETGIELDPARALIERAEKVRDGK